MEQSDGEPKCQHGLAPHLYTSWKQGGRRFYRCPKPIGEEQCKYFVWEDELVSAVPQTQTRNQGLPPTPQTGGPSTSIRLELPQTPTPARIIKRNLSDSEDGPSIFQDRGKRLKIDFNKTLSRFSPHLGDAQEDYDAKRLKPQTPVRPGKGAVKFLPSVASPPLTPIKTRATFIKSMDAGPSSQETLAGDETLELSAESIAEMLESLSNIPEYIGKLERKKVAAEKSRDAKAKKIDYLEGEVERLKQREKELEELVTLLERDR